MGKITRRHFPLVSRASMQSQNQLACKYSFPFTLGDEVGALSLLPGHLSSPCALTHWSCALGNFSLGDGIPLLNMLSLSPFTDQDVQSPACEWELILFNQYLSPELANLFGEIKRCDRAENDVLSTRLIVRLGERRVEGRLYLSHTSLAHWLRQPGWQPQRYTLPDTLTYVRPLVLGRITLHTSQLHALQEGDVLVPPVNYFSPDGKGCVNIAGYELVGTLQLPHHFVITHLERTALNPYETEGSDAVSKREHLASDDHVSLAMLPLSLEVRCGRTRLTLGELQHLQPGSVLTLDNMTPGEADLYYGETLIAQGELVDVEGQLGLQLTRLLLTLQQV
ncbi:FliM/FliN family flagellar motor switch protein [Pantoea stewartii subsp. indologenes]|uniref:FliM/FliN family flagellar motor switch protein n=1 Tax=Pantoea stewartii TaxID=66269 RepID=UPI003FA44456